MKWLLVHPPARYSVADVSIGYREALLARGHEIVDYWMHKHMAYHFQALPVDVRDSMDVLSRKASETILNEALYQQVDRVLLISGLNLHPIALWGLHRVGIPATVVFTESPYDDPQQREWSDAHPMAQYASNDEASAVRHGWVPTPPAYRPAVHRPVDPDGEPCDVLLVGTGWPERQNFLEAVNWEGIQLRLAGVWPHLDDRSRLHRFLDPHCYANELMPARYAHAKIVLNFHRRHPLAVSPNPRAYEVAACGAFQVSDPRPGVIKLFGDSIPIYHSPEELEQIVRYYLDRPDEREDRSAEARRRVADETFDARVETLLRAA